MFSPWALTCLLLMFVLGFVYFYWIRPYLRTLPGFAEAYDREATLWQAIKTWSEGRRTLFVGLWGEIVAIGPDALQQLSGLDLKALMGLPDLWAAWVTAVIPILMLILRSRAK